MNIDRAGRVPHLVGAGLLGIIAFTLVLAATDPPGPGLDPDAMAYLGAAESVALTGQYRVPTAPWGSADSTLPLTHFPPGYSTALALPVRLGMEAPQAARLIGALAAAVTVATLMLLAVEATTLLAGALLIVALFATDAMGIVHVSVLSEPLFLACMALTLAAMTRPRPHSLAIGVPAALGLLTRYAGVALAGAGALWMFGMPGPLPTRLRRAAFALLPSVLLQGAWMIRLRQLHERTPIRRFAVYGKLGPTLLQGGATIRDWLVPDANALSDPMPYRSALAIAAALAAAMLIFVGTRHALASTHPSSGEGAPVRANPAPARLLAACALLIACYVGMLVLSRLVADPGIPFDARILVPVVLLASVAIAISAALWWRATRLVLPRAILAVALACWGMASAVVTGDHVRYALDWGSDFAGEQWRRSELLAWGRTGGALHPLYTNWPSAVYFHLRRPSRSVPKASDTTLLAAFADTLRAHDGRALVFTVPDADYMNRELLVHAGVLRVVAEVEDGVVLAARRR